MNVSSRKPMKRTLVARSRRKSPAGRAGARVTGIVDDDDLDFDAFRLLGANAGESALEARLPVQRRDDDRNGLHAELRHAARIEDRLVWRKGMLTFVPQR